MLANNRYSELNRRTDVVLSSACVDLQLTRPCSQKTGTDLKHRATSAGAAGRSGRSGDDVGATDGSVMSLARRHHESSPVSYTHLTLPTNREV